MLKTYKRDKRSPTPKNENTSLIMSKIRAKGTKPELIVKKYIYELGYRGYRLNYKKVEGRPDICFTKNKKAIFINGCFWHRCPHCNLSIPKHNKKIWTKKFNDNVKRDKQKRERLIENGWKVITIWECQIKKNQNWQKKLLKDLKD